MTEETRKPWEPDPSKYPNVLPDNDIHGRLLRLEMMVTRAGSIDGEDYDNFLAWRSRRYQTHLVNNLPGYADRLFDAIPAHIKEEVNAAYPTAKKLHDEILRLQHELDITEARKQNIKVIK